MKNVDKMIVSWKDYIESKLETIETRFIAMDKATELIGENNKVRFENQNKWREELRERSAIYFPRSEHELFRSRVEDDLISLKKSRDENTGKASVKSVYMAYFISFLSIIVSILSILF